MSGIPTTFNDGLPSYTVVGGYRCGPRGISAVLLCQRERVERRETYRLLKNAGFEFVLSIEEKSLCPGIERLTADYPFVRFILLNEPLSAGSQINLAAAEIQDGSFFVLRKDCALEPSEAAFKAAPLIGDAQALCVTPRMFGSGKSVLPVQPVLEFSSGALRTKLAEPVDGARNVFPFEGIGVYNRELFVRLGGYDNSIPDEYWQLMDFGLRACLWGENIVSTGAIRLTRGGSIAEYQAVIDESYRRCYLKNILPVYRLDAAYLPLRRFLTFLSRSGLSLPLAWEEFSAARRWVNQNAYRWKCDARVLPELWGGPADFVKKEPAPPAGESV